MKSLTRFTIFTTTFTMAMFASAAQASTIPGPLVETDWLAANADKVTILDLRADLKSFAAKPIFKKDKKTGKQKLVRVGGHISGAHLVNYKKVRGARSIAGNKVDKMLPAKADFETYMQEAGLDKGKAIVIVTKGESNADMTMAARLYWQLKYYGEDDMAILNGGMAQWIIDGRKVSSGSAKAAKGNWVATAERDEILASSDDVEQARQNGSAQLMDNRPIDQYLGVWHKSYVYANGHIPGARSFANSLLTQPKAPAKFLPTQTLTSLAQGLGLNPEKPTIAYCNSGHLAAGGWFILHELMGNKQAKLYDGSMHEWTLEKRPVTALVLEK